MSAALELAREIPERTLCALQCLDGHLCRNLAARILAYHRFSQLALCRQKLCDLSDLHQYRI